MRPKQSVRLKTGSPTIYSRRFPAPCAHHGVTMRIVEQFETFWTLELRFRGLTDFISKLGTMHDVRLTATLGTYHIPLPLVCLEEFGLYAAATFEARIRTINFDCIREFRTAAFENGKLIAFICSDFHNSIYFVRIENPSFHPPQITWSVRPDNVDQPAGEKLVQQRIV